MNENKNNDTFFSLPEEYSDYDKSKIVIIQVPFEGTLSYGKGSSHAPKEILKASHEVELYDEEINAEPFDAGISTGEIIDNTNSAEEITSRIKETIAKHITNNKFPIMIGGDHTISLGAIQAIKEKYSDLTILHIDAHSDLRDEFEGQKLNHATVMHRVYDLGIKLVQVGIRSMSKEEKDSLDSLEIKSRIHFAKDIARDDLWIDKVIESLGEYVYITFDLDALDPSIMPSTGTPEPGGLSWYQTTELLREVCLTKNVVGIDFVELAPIENLHAPNYLVARLIYKFIGYRFLDREVSNL